MNELTLIQRMFAFLRQHVGLGDSTCLKRRQLQNDSLNPADFQSILQFELASS